MHDETVCCVWCERAIDDDEPRCGDFESGEYACEACAPSYGDMLTEPEAFANSEGEPLTFLQARAIVDAHIAQGGSVYDKIVTS